MEMQILTTMIYTILAHQNCSKKKKKKVPNVDRNVEQLELSYITGKAITQYNHFEKN